MVVAGSIFPPFDSRKLPSLDQYDQHAGLYPRSPIRADLRGGNLDQVMGISRDKTMVKQMQECQKRNEKAPNSFWRIGKSNQYTNVLGQVIERVSQNGSITYLTIKGDN